MTPTVALFIVALNGLRLPDIKGHTMSEHYFNALEQKIDRLLARLQALEAENTHLREQDARLREERAQLLQLHDQTRDRVENMISRLKALEQQS